ncbi:Helicase associated domain protein [Streptomyces sp. HNM0645]|uniref:Helicase associated domain protein n=1 Tax=Streptomyces sp. HNM0645 TaxID=2782343 RepID=UPI0024B63D17|nr:Helicase associated domain protein [Streptomyces sp. HNM0645]MDI9889385.1 Helicase associated domain protein [Streptomyces sp. HNM0645]
MHRAIRRDLTRGERAGLKSGEAARRAHDVFGQRPPTHRNAAWEGDHKHVPVEVDVEGELATPWVTWFIDCATKAITGAAVTAHAPSRDAVLASLRIAITRSEPFGPVGGLPGQIRVDRGKEFLCQTVTAAMGALAVPVTDLPAYSPHLKGTIEALNDAVEEMFLVSLPRYTGRQKLNRGRLADPDAPPLTYEAFVGLLLDWVCWWNTRHHPSALNGRTPIQAWQAGATPLTDVSAGQLATFALEDDGRTYTISTSGVRWRRRDYLAPWMNGRTGTKVSVRHLPHHDDTIEVFDAATGRHLGSAFLAAAASREQIRSVQAARTAAARRLKADLKAAEKLRRRRFEASTTAAPPRPLTSSTSAQAEEELGAAAQTDRRALARPDLVPHGPAPDTYSGVRALVVDGGAAVDEITPGVTVHGADVGRWLARQRETWAELSAAQRERLAVLGVTAPEPAAAAPKAGGRAAAWERGLAAARAYHAREGTLTGVSRGHVEHVVHDGQDRAVKLGVWLANQRNRRAKLPTDRAHVLTELGAI